MLVDKPATELDTENMLRIIDLLVGLSQKLGRTITASIHDLQIAVRTNRRLRLEDERVKETYGPPDQCLGVMRAEKRADITGVLKNKPASSERKLEEPATRYVREENRL